MNGGIQMSKRVIVVDFTENAKAYQAFSEVKKAHLARKIKGEQMAVVTHSAEGAHHFKVEDFLDFTGNNKTSRGGMIGMLIGILGGPLGVFLGWFGGSMIGASQDAQEIKKANTIFELLSKNIGEGQTGLILIAEEEDNRPLNDIIMYELGGTIHRFDYEEVEEELQKAQQVEQVTKESAQKNWEESHPEEK